MCLHVCKSAFPFNILDSKRKVLDHIVLFGYSKMELAVQVLSRTENGDPEVAGTDIIWQMINDFLIVLMYRQEQKAKKSNHIPLLMTSGLYGCRKPS